MERIVVGVDGSEHSKRAIRRAVAEAELRGCSVEAVFVYPAPRRSVTETVSGWPAGFLDDPDRSGDDRSQSWERKARELLQETVASAMEGVSGTMPRLITTDGEHPAETLIETAEGAAMLVIGTRGLGGFKGMLLGSVANQAAQRARCPVLILPPETE